MFAVIEDGSRQYRVQEGDVVTLDYREVEKGTRLELNKVLLYQNGDDVQIGKPLVVGARVLGEVVGESSIKTYIGKFRRRKNYRRLRGHRQHYTRIQIRNILLAGQEPPPPPAPPATPPVSETPSTPPAPTPPAPPAPSA
jgi:large subunit ribosomal protein L21